jgi:hypothetical protein
MNMKKIHKLDNPTSREDMQAVVDRIKSVYRSWGSTTTTAQMRSDWDRLFSTTIESEAEISTENVSINGIHAQWITAKNTLFSWVRF